MTQYVYAFADADGSDRDRFGGKGAGLAEMTRIGLRVPPGFIVTTEACRHVIREGAVPDELWAQVDEALARLEGETGRTFGDGPAPLLVSVRSGAKISMPGMMDTVLNLGLNDELVEVAAEWAGDRHFAWDVYRRFLQMYGHVVLDVPSTPFEEVLAELRRRRDVPDDSKLTADDLAEAARRFHEIIRTTAGEDVPDDPRTQLREAITAVFDSWNNDRARRYRSLNDIPDDLGTAANVQMMVFGDLGEDSGTGVCFTRNPSTGEPAPFGDYLPNAQGEDVVAGIRNTLTLDDLARLHPELHRELLAVMQTLERHYRDMCDIEFTIERGTLWILQTRIGKRTAAAAVRIAVDMADEGLIEPAEAVMRVEPATLEQLERPRIDDATAPDPLVVGVGASPGAAQGEAIFDADRAEAAAAEGRRVILVRPETTPDDIGGMAAAEGILTSQGGKTSHAAVVARGMGKPAVTGAAEMKVHLEAKVARIGRVTIAEGDPITIDGTSGRVFLGLLPLVEPTETPELEKLLGWADEFRTMGVRANADLPEDAAAARRSGAEGIGLARTEHMFLGERLQTVQNIILAEDDERRRAGLEELRAAQVDDFEGLLEAMDGLPVIVRLLDPPLHEFLPSRLEIERRMVELAKAGKSTAELEALERAVAKWAEDNPMLGLRGVRLGLMVHDLYRIQVEAAMEAVIRRLDAGGDPRLEIMIPLVATAEELRRMKEMVDDVVAAASERAGRSLHVPVGTMIELPRAALTAAEIAEVAEFFSFGTNDLTQMTFGLSRDDAEGLFLRDYLERGILSFDPFNTIDVAGVGRLVRIATEEGRQTNPDLQVGVCGEHGGDPDSIRFFQEVGIDYVSCSPPRVHVARLAAAQTALRAKGVNSG